MGYYILLLLLPLLGRHKHKSQCAKISSVVPGPAVVEDVSRPRQGSLGREDGCVGQWAARRRLFTSSKDALDECVQAAWARRYRRHDNFRSLRPGDRDPCRSTPFYCWAPTERPTKGTWGAAESKSAALLAAPLLSSLISPCPPAHNSLRYGRLVGRGCFRLRQRADTSETYSDTHDTNRDALT